MQISLQITGIWIAVGGISPLTNVLIVWFLPGMFVPSSNGHELSLFLTAMVHFVVGLGFVLGKNAIMQKIDRWRNPSGASDVLRAEFKDVSQDDSQTISPVK